MGPSAERTIWLGSETSDSCAPACRPFAAPLAVVPSPPRELYLPGPRVMVLDSLRLRDPWEGIPEHAQAAV